MESTLSTIKSLTVYPSTPTGPGIPSDKVYSFCGEVSDEARGSSARFTVAGWATAIPAAAALFYAGQVGTDPTHKTFVRRNPGTLLLTSSVILGVASAFFFSRSDAATTASVRAHNAHTAPDANDAYAECVAAKSYWIGSRTESNALVRQMQNSAGKQITQDSGSELSKKLIKDPPPKEDEAAANQLKDVQQKLQELTKRLDALSATPERSAKTEP